ncbi:hypothetical protein OS493_019827 [Desmophyllum pertusum]|uniref:P5A-ATPase transmembrane helical hairpin domain-containing protein n=1 Tax=Desmophyllum pertusum TaxID=174260 RepID=A0A9W9YZJ3_9CNID|nr:hypothetical protein OS493_019827 [Desmophyllum pertusum]
MAVKFARICTKTLETSKDLSMSRPCLFTRIKSLPREIERRSCRRTWRNTCKDRVKTEDEFETAVRMTSGPFIPLYLTWLYFWTVVYGVTDYFEAGLIALAVVGILQILSCLFCHWSVHVRCLFTCSTENIPTLATVIKVVPTANNGSPELLNLLHEQDKETQKEVILVSTFKRQSMCMIVKKRSNSARLHFQSTNPWDITTVVKDIRKKLRLKEPRKNMD